MGMDAGIHMQITHKQNCTTADDAGRDCAAFVRDTLAVRDTPSHTNSRRRCLITPTCCSMTPTALYCVLLMEGVGLTVGVVGTDTTGILCEVCEVCEGREGV